jgi:hypothetical protein
MAVCLSVCLRWRRRLSIAIKEREGERKTAIKERDEPGRRERGSRVEKSARQRRVQDRDK